uniref:Uncharacterized protein n=1 Tax=Piliocolobus tephrosceles TaxID=591936 RepID=A0A8C9IJ75_9PRIM
QFPSPFLPFLVSQPGTQWGFCHVGQAGLELLVSSCLPTLASRSAGITGVSHHAWALTVFHQHFRKCDKIGNQGPLSPEHVEGFPGSGCRVPAAQTGQPREMERQGQAGLQAGRRYWEDLSKSRQVN